MNKRLFSGLFLLTILTGLTRANILEDNLTEINSQFSPELLDFYANSPSESPGVQHLANMVNLLLIVTSGSLNYTNVMLKKMNEDFANQIGNEVTLRQTQVNTINTTLNNLIALLNSTIIQHEIEDDLKFALINARLNLLEVNMSVINGQIAGLQNDLRNIRASISDLQASDLAQNASISNLNSLASGLQSQIDVINGKLIIINSQLSVHSDNITTLFDLIKQLRIDLTLLGLNVQGIQGEVGAINNTVNNYNYTNITNEIINNVTNEIYKIKIHINNIKVDFAAISQDLAGNYTDCVNRINKHRNDIEQEIAGNKSDLQNSANNKYKEYDGKINNGYCKAENAAPGQNKIYTTILNGNDSRWNKTGKRSYVGTITFSSPFSSIPVVTATILNRGSNENGNGNGNGNNFSDSLTVVVTNITSTGCVVNVTNNSKDFDSVAFSQLALSCACYGN